MRALEFITGHVIFKLRYDQIYHLKTTIIIVKLKLQKCAQFTMRGLKRLVVVGLSRKHRQMATSKTQLCLLVKVFISYLHFPP